MAAVAAEARVTKQTVYRYYASKNDLFSAVVGELADRLQADILDLVPASVIPASGLERTLLRLGQRILDHILDPTYLDLFRVVIADARKFPELPERLRTLFIGRGASALSHFLRADEIGFADLSSIGSVQRLFAGSLLTFMLDGLLGDPAAARARADEHLPTVVHVLVTAVQSGREVR